jgi:hypothetical protein
MSNDTTFTSEVFDRTVDPSINKSFTRDKLEADGVKLEVFTPTEDRPQHLHFTAWNTEVRDVNVFLASTGEVCTTLRLTVGERNVEVSLWGVTLDTLASAIEAAQRDSDADAWHCDECGEVCDTPGAVSSEHAAGCSLHVANVD